MTFICVDGNEAAARIAHAVSEVVAIYPITPASPMGELADAWSARGQKNVWGVVPEVIEMQSEGGAAGAVHGALQAGALTTTFTASQGLLLMIPNMYKIAGELTPAVIHVAARSIATHALSIFGDHSDVMAARATGFAMLASASVQEAHDMALIAHAATLEARVPFLHFFDGFRTSHEINKIAEIDDDTIRAMIDPGLIDAHRDRALDPDRPVLRGTAQNPDVFFQAREAINPFYLRTAAIVQRKMDQLGKLVGRHYRLFEYVGAPDAERALVIMGSGCGAVREAVDELSARGEKVGAVFVRLYRPFDTAALLEALPRTAKRIAVLDRTKEPGAPAEPLHLDLARALFDEEKLLIGGRYGLSSKELTPSMVEAIYGELKEDRPKRSFTIGIHDDVTDLSLKWDGTPRASRAGVHSSVFFGLGSDGTVGATKNSVKIIGEETDLFAQGYFVYDSKKSGATTVSHLRFSERPIDSTYLIQTAQFVACHQLELLSKMDVLSVAGSGATLLLNAPYPADEVFGRLPIEAREQILDKNLELHVVDAYAIAREAGLGGRINTVMQTCFFALSDVLETDAAIAAIKRAVAKSYQKAGRAIVARNEAAIDAALAGLKRVALPAEVGAGRRRAPRVPEDAPDFVRRVTGMILEGRGELLPVSAMPVDGTFETGTARYERRSIARTIPIWDPDICTKCGLCPLVCPHAAIRMKAYPEENQDASLPCIPYGDGRMMTIQVAPDDCTGCGVCVEVCPARSKEVVKHKAINMEDKEPHLTVERARFETFLGLPATQRSEVRLETVKGSQQIDPLFEFSGACAGCGETPYLKLLTQLFGDRLVVANATGCSSIYGGNLPTTPWTKDESGKGPAWSNSLFEDNAEFGLGMRLAIDSLTEQAISGTESLARYRQPRSVWIVGGDGWAYDIGFGGLDHVLASGKNVNILVLDTEVYSNTGGQASKATPRAAVAKFAASGKSIGKKDLGMIAMAYGNVYVAQIAMGASPNQTIKAMIEAESYPGPSLLIAYSTCIAHGVDMTKSMERMKEAAKSGYWPLYRYDPRLADGEGHPFHLDSRRPSLPFRKFAMKEARFAMLTRSDPERAERLLRLAQRDIDERWRYYEQLAGLERTLVEETT